jgi:hypothetical protein
MERDRPSTGEVEMRIQGGARDGWTVSMSGRQRQHDSNSMLETVPGDRRHGGPGSPEQESWAEASSTLANCNIFTAMDFIFMVILFLMVTTCFPWTIQYWQYFQDKFNWKLWVNLREKTQATTLVEKAMVKITKMAPEWLKTGNNMVGRRPLWVPLFWVSFVHQCSSCPLLFYFSIQNVRESQPSHKTSLWLGQTKPVTQNAWTEQSIFQCTERI